MAYYSQYKQDEILNDYYFKNARNGIFLDIGAHDGDCFSNSKFFEEELGWTGICIEPNPDVFKLLEQNRKCVCVNKAVYIKTGTVLFSKNSGRTELLSGIVEKYGDQHLKRIDEENSIYGGSVSRVELECDTINNILECNNITTVDYLSIDTEGSEYDILSTLDFSKFHINVIDVEINYPEVDGKKIYELLINNGFNCLGQLGCDFIFENKSLNFTFND